MPSINCSRRRLLAAGGSLSATIAGCTGFGESDSATHNATEGGEPLPSDEYELLTLRVDEPEPFVSADDDQPGDRVDRPYRRWVAFVLSEDDATALEIDADGAADARAFLEATDFETESVVIEQREIDDCYRRELLSVQADADGFRTQYCRSLKEPTTPCEADVTAMEAIFVRVQHAYDDAPSSRASSESGSCPPSVRAVGRDEASAAGDAGSEGDDR